jgi:DNA polymerase-4
MSKKPPAIARKIKDEVRARLGLVASVGAAPSKFVAKIASDFGKPDGLVVVREGEERAFLHPLPASRLWGVGKVTEAVLTQLGLRTVGDVARAGEAVLALKLGRESARRLAQLADGVDARSVESERAPVSVGHEDTFEDDLHSGAALEPHLYDQADRVCVRLRELGLRGRTITLKVKYADHQRASRRITLERGTSDGRVVAREAIALLAEVPDLAARGVRLSGVSVSALEPRDGPRQLSLDVAGPERSEARSESLGDALDAIARKFGRSAVKRALHLRSNAGETDDGD